MEQQILSVSQVNQIIKSLLDSIPQLAGIYVRGEISNYKLYPSGHHYFTLRTRPGPSAASCLRDRPPACGSARPTA